MNIFAHLVAVTLCLLVLSMCVSSISDQVEHVVCLFTIHASSYMKFWWCFLPIFLLGCLSFSYCFVGGLETFCTRILGQLRVLLPYLSLSFGLFHIS